LVADADGRWRPLEHEELVRGLRQLRDRLHRGGAGADDADALAAQLLHRLAGAAAGDRVVPAAGVEGLALERRDARDARQLRLVQDAAGDDEEARRQLIAAVGRDVPTVTVVVPRRVR